VPSWSRCHDDDLLVGDAGAIEAFQALRGVMDLVENRMVMVTSKLSGSLIKTGLIFPTAKIHGGWIYKSRANFGQDPDAQPPCCQLFTIPSGGDFVSTRARTLARHRRRLPGGPRCREMQSFRRRHQREYISKSFLTPS